MDRLTEDWIIGMLATNPRIWSWVEQLMGEGEVKRPEKPTIRHCDVTPDKLDL